MIFRRAAKDDAVALSQLGQETFIETFGHLYTSENLNAFLLNDHSAECYHDLLTRKDCALWVMEQDGELIAYAVAAPCTLPHHEHAPKGGELKRAYVLSRHHGRGLGTKLIETALTWLEDEGYDPIYLSVFSENLGAQRLYRRMGFEKVREYIFHVGEHEDLEFIFKRERNA